MRFRVVLFGLFVLVSGPVLAESSGEQLFVPSIADWTMAYHHRQEGVELTEIVPRGQTAKDWKEMLAVRIAGGAAPKTAEAVLKDILGEIEAGCEAADAGPIHIASENGYDTALRAIICPKSKEWGQGELSLFKVIRGADRVYVVSRVWRGEAFERNHLPVSPETTKQWLAFMGRVTLCDQRDPRQHLCPTPKAP